MTLHGRVALVTGAGRGIGRSHALTLAALGAAVVVNDVGADATGRGVDVGLAESVVAEIEQAGGRAVADATDVGSIIGGSTAVHAAIEAFGRIDIVVNNAGFALGGGSVFDPVETEIDRQMAIHLKAAIGTMQAGMADMRLRSWGRVVNTVSEAALDARFTGSLGYGAAKAALWSATLTAATEAGPNGITVNAISPGARTRMNAELLDRGFRSGASSHLDLDPACVSRVVAFLVSDEAADVNGCIIHAAGGEVREYTTRRTARSRLVERIQAAIV